jgi:cyclohexyl-isocyanide hydratase
LSDFSPDGSNRLYRTILEVLSRIPNSTIHVIAKTKSPVRDIQELILTLEMTIAEATEFDVLLVPGGYGQQQLMNDEEVLSLIRNHFAAGRLVFSVCMGALLCGAAGILRGRQATMHWAAWNLLPYYGATPVRSRVVVDGDLVTAAGVTADLMPRWSSPRCCVGAQSLRKFN